ncbi:MAG: recombinase family protein [Candidatus Gastranaerophilales bacterium]|nr:recombinase family protein [Candidatus Gastranaerophilales bacterium]
MGFRNKHGNRVAKSSVKYILHNISYTGKFEYNDVIIENTDYPALISEATYYAVQEKLDTPCKTRQNHTQFPYNEVMTCSKCGCQMTGEVKRKKRKDGSTRSYIYYHCTENRG